MNASEDPTPNAADSSDATNSGMSCVMSFNANDPSGATGLAADVAAIASASCHVLPVLTALQMGDTHHVRHHIPLEDEVVEEQARSALEDIAVQAFKIGFAGNPDNILAIAKVLSDYDGVPVVGYMPDLAWCEASALESYHDTYAGLLLPHVTVLVGNHNTLSRWLLPDWEQERPPTARDIARVAASLGTPYTLVTGIVTPDQWVENQLSSPDSIVTSARYERFNVSFQGAGDTLAAVFSALLASGHELPEACASALDYLNRSLGAGFRPGMGYVIPDRLFWAHEANENGPPPDATADEATAAGHELLSSMPCNAIPH